MLARSSAFPPAHVAGERATLAVDGTPSVHGAAGFDERLTGTAVYAVDVLSPVELDLTARTRRQITSDQTDTTDAHLIATLVSDSFPKH